MLYLLLVTRYSHSLIFIPGSNYFLKFNMSKDNQQTRNGIDPISLINHLTKVRPIFICCISPTQLINPFIKLQMALL